MLKTALAISCILFIVSCENKSATNALPYYNTANFDPQFLSSIEAEKKINHTIANFSMTDQYNQTITQKDIEGKIHVANFFFTSCGSICPKMTNNLIAVQDILKKDKSIVLFSYSVTPWKDNVPVLKSFAKEYKITSPNWHLLTGKKEEIYELARKSYFAEENIGFSKDTSEFLHTEHILLVDKNKKIRGIYNATLELEIQQLIKDISTLKKE
ncbi:MAG: SCO family protein [Flavobacterium sp.]|nr:SCO family protein [Flavobacterium sp.]